MKTKIVTTLLALFLLFPLESISQNKDFKIKGFHIDFRCEVMTMPALKDFAKELSEMGINTIVMEWEASFPYRKHATISNKYAYSEEEIKSFIEYCESLSIDVIPLQNCFGHVEYILRHDRYAHLKEDSKEVSQICPVKTEECKVVFKELFQEMTALHPSKYLHIGGDETYLLGHCKLCSAKAEKEGKSKLFVDYVKEMCKLANELGKQPILWADIIVKYPEAVNELPKDAIFVDWNYGWEKDRFGKMDNLYNAGVTFWGAPSIRSYPDNIYLTQWEKHFNNQRTFVPYSREAGYEGMIMTSWSTSGLYGFLYDNGWEVIDMYPIRYVYPLSGFRMLVAAYGQSLNQNAPLNPEEFVTNYAQNRFGFTAKESQLVWQILTSPQEDIKNGKDNEGKSVSEIKKQALNLQNQMSTLKAKSNTKEFEHLRLMIDIRVEYLKFKEIEARYQSSEFDRSKAGSFLQELKGLVADAKKIDARFTELNKGYLMDEGIKEINTVRNQKLLITYETLSNLSK